VFIPLFMRIHLVAEVQAASNSLAKSCLCTSSCTPYTLAFSFASSASLRQVFGIQGFGFGARGVLDSWPEKLMGGIWGVSDFGLRVYFLDSSSIVAASSAAALSLATSSRRSATCIRGSGGQNCGVPQGKKVLSLTTKGKASAERTRGEFHPNFDFCQR
jgi:hypothetical protein